LAWIIVVLVIGPVRADEQVVPVDKNKTAPFTGLLVQENRFTELLGAEIDAKQLAGELQIQKNLTTNLEAVYNEKLREAVKPVPWYERPSFNRWLGFGIGVVVTFLAIWGGAELGKSFR